MVDRTFAETRTMNEKKAWKIRVILAGSFETDGNMYV